MARGRGLANVLLSPRRKGLCWSPERCFCSHSEGNLVRLEGRLAKSPSFWVKNVDVVRKYEQIAGVVVPVALESRPRCKCSVKPRHFRMTYSYSEIAGRDVRSQAIEQ